MVFQGYLSNVGDVDDMAKNAISILKDKKTHDTFRNNALKRAKEFELSKILPLYENLYERVINS
jgi:glycosyltransferase involved in cell wall biosynthesis